MTEASRSSYTEEIDEALASCGLRRRVGTESSNFDAAFVWRGLLTTVVFLLKDLRNEGADEHAVRNVVNAGRKWCAKNLVTLPVIREAGLNLILLHQGQLPARAIKGQVDTTGFHRAIVQSITAIDVSSGSVTQEQTWVIVGKVGKALKLLAGITNV